MPLIGGVGRSGTSTPLPTGVNYSAIRATDVGDFQGTYTPVWGDPGRSRAVNSSNPPISQLVDDFGFADATKWTFPAGSSVGAGQLTINCTLAGVTVTSVDVWSLADSAIYVRLSSPPPLGNGGQEAFFSIGSLDGNNQVRWAWSGGNILAQYFVGGTKNLLLNTAYDPVAHKWWRIQQTAGTVFWDTAPDGVTWTNRASWTPTIDLSSVYVWFTADFFGTEPSPGSAVFDDVNTLAVDAAASGSITLGGTAAGSAQPTSAGSILLFGSSGTGKAVAASTGSVTLGGSGGTPSAAATASGAITLAGSGAGTAVAAASGSITLTGTGAASARPTAAGSITLAGTGTAGASATSAGTVTLGGTATAGATAAATGSVTLGGTATGQARAAAAGTVTLGGSPAAAGQAAATGAITLGGSGTAATSTSPIASTNGTTSGTSAAVTLPAYQAGDALLMIVSRNQTEANPFTFSSSITSAIELSNVGTRRLTALLLTPNGAGQTSTTVTWTTSAVFTWWIGVYRGYDLAAAVDNAGNALGNSTSSTVTPPTTSLDYLATGNELAVSVVGLNATGIWTGSADTIYTTGSSTNGALEIGARRPAAGALSVTHPSVDRGNNGTARNTSALSLVLQADPVGVPNLLTNGSFETAPGSGVATGWTDEHLTVGAPAYTLVTSPISDGGKAQQIQYAGQPTDDPATSKFEIYQSLIPASPGDVLTFTVDVSGSINDTYALIGIEAFDSSHTYISESDTSIPTLTGALTRYSVTYICPAATNYVAVYAQVPAVTPTTSATVILDRATLTKVPSASGAITLGGGGAPAAVPTATGSISLAGTATATATAATSGTITLTGQGTARATASSGGSITLAAGAAQLSAFANTTGSIQLAGLATGTGSGTLILHAGPDETLIVLREDRTIVVIRESRTGIAVRESRIVRVPREARVLTVPADLRLELVRR